MIGFRDPSLVDVTGDERTRLARAQSEILEFFHDLVQERRRRPGDDVISMLLGSELNGRPVGDRVGHRYAAHYVPLVYPPDIAVSSRRLWLPEQGRGVGVADSVQGDAESGD
jgi:hypothetical protein